MIGRTVFLLWKRGQQGQRGLRLVATPAGLAVCTDHAGREVCLVLDRDEAQRMRHAVTTWLVDAAPEPERRAS